MTTKVFIQNATDSNKSVRIHHFAPPSKSAMAAEAKTDLDLKPGEAHEVWVHDTLSVSVEELP